MEEDKGEGKQAEDQRVFFRFGNDLAVDDNPQRATAACHKIAIQEAISVVIEGSRKEIPDGLVQNAGTHPSRSILARIRQTASRDANPHIIRVSAIFIQVKKGNGSVAAADSDGRRVGGVVGKRGSRAPNSRRSGSHRGNVSGVGTRKQGRQREVGIVGLVVVEKVVARSSPTVSA